MVVAKSETRPGYPESELMARAAWHYYVEGLTQEKIAERLNVGRVKVHRLISAAREEGVVQIRIRDSVAQCVHLEKELKQRFNLGTAIVVPAAADSTNTAKLIGYAAGTYLANNINQDDVIALGWGRTLKFAIDHLEPRTIAGTEVVSLLGGLARAQTLNPAECAWELAEKIGADCYLLPVPVFADRPDQREIFMSQRSVQDVLFRARRANTSVLSVGSLSLNSPILNYGFVKPSELEELQAAGAVGDLLCHFLDADGNLVDHEVNRRVCAFPTAELSEVPNAILISGGRDKVAIINAAMKRCRTSVLITDEDAADGLLNQ